jgi:hypothetical protein
MGAYPEAWQVAVCGGVWRRYLWGITFCDFSRYIVLNGVSIPDHWERHYRFATRRLDCGFVCMASRREGVL